jgi:transposase
LDHYPRLSNPGDPPALVAAPENANGCSAPCSRLAPVRAPNQSTRLEHGYKRAGALHLFAAFDTRTGKVYARTEVRKRQKEFIALLTQLDREIPPSIRRISLVLDNSSVHTGKQVRAWLQAHPRFVCWFLPVHCSWMNQIEQWFCLVQRKRLRISDFTDLDHLAQRLMAFVAEWNAHAHPFNWSTRSAAKVMAKYQAQTEARMTFESSFRGAVSREGTEDKTPAEDDLEGNAI